MVDEFLTFIQESSFPCIGAKAAAAKQQMRCMVVGSMEGVKDDSRILQFLYQFVDDFRDSSGHFHSAAILFNTTKKYSEEKFDELLWKRLQALSIQDAKYYPYDIRVDTDTSSASFSYSLKEEAFFIIGMHPSSSRLARQFKYPTLVFNPHIQFEELRETNRYEPFKAVVRKRDIALSGSINPMLQDFGHASEVYQYSGRKYDETWQCPFKTNHETIDHHTSL